MKSVLPAAKGLSQVNPGRVGPASRPDPPAPGVRTTYVPISETPRLFVSSERRLVASVRR